MIRVGSFINGWNVGVIFGSEDDIIRPTTQNTQMSSRGTFLIVSLLINILHDQKNLI
jgi:hypothetical protein